MAPYFCHVGNHLYQPSVNRDGCQHPACIALRNAPSEPLGVLVGTIQGGFRDTSGDPLYDSQKNFDKGLDAYRKARGEGLQPKSSTVEAVAEAQNKVRAHKRALKKLGLKAGEVKVAPGVE